VPSANSDELGVWNEQHVAAVVLCGEPQAASFPGSVHPAALERCSDMDFNHVVERGSDGSRVLLDFHAHFTVNANGETTVQFETERIVPIDSPGVRAARTTERMA
jgi:hypothetical protein